MHTHKYLKARHRGGQATICFCLLLFYSTALPAQSPHWPVRSVFSDSEGRFLGDFALSNTTQIPLQLTIQGANQFGLRELNHAGIALSWRQQHRFSLSLQNQHWLMGSFQQIEGSAARHITSVALNLSITKYASLAASFQYRTQFERKTLNSEIGINYATKDVGFGFLLLRPESLFLTNATTGGATSGSPAVGRPRFAALSWFSQRLDGNIFAQAGLKFQLDHPVGLYGGLAYMEPGQAGCFMGLQFNGIDGFNGSNGANGAGNSALQSWEFGFSTGSLPQLPGSLQGLFSVHPLLGWSTRLLYTIDLKGPKLEKQ